MAEPRPVGVSVEKLHHDEAGSVASLLARGFDDDPLFRFLLPRSAGRQHVLRSVFARTIADAFPFGEVYAARHERDLVGVLVCLPPGAFPPTTLRNLRLLPALLSAAIRFPSSLRRIARVLAADSKAHVTYRHWYLPCLGVDPAVQGRGIGTTLLSRVLGRIDMTPEPVFLVTSRPRNVPWYEKHEFATIAEMRPLASGPPCWAMVRPSCGLGVELGLP